MATNEKKRPRVYRIYSDSAQPTDTEQDVSALKLKMNSIAGPFAATESYNAGEYVWYNNVLYVFTADHAAGSWTGSDAEQVVLTEEMTDQITELKTDFDDLNEFCRKEIIETITGSANVTSGTSINKSPALVNCNIPSGTTYKFKLQANNRIGTFYLYANGSNIKNGCVPETEYEFTASSNITEIGIYASATNVIGTGEITGIITIATHTDNSLEERIGTLNDLETTEKTNLVGAINEVKNSVPDFPINPDDTSFFHISKNMIDPSTCVSGEYVNQATGTFVSLAGHNRTTYIEVAENTIYVVRARNGALGADFRYVFYNSAKGYISGAVGALPDMLLTSPANAKYIVISDTPAPSNMMIASYVDEDKSFEAFDNVYVKPQFIVTEEADDIVLNLPEKVYALVGYELNIYFDNITENSEKYTWDVTCTKGMQLERGYRITPVAGDVGTYSLTIKASISDTVYKEVTTSLIVSAIAEGSVSVIVLGDSTTYNGIMVGKLHDNFTADGVTLSTLGTMGTSPNNHEGRSGWTVDDYFTKASIVYPSGDPRGTIYNAFYNPTTQTFDADYYFTNSGVSKPDWFFINMGINDVFGYTTDTALLSAMTTILDRYDLMVESIQEASPNTKVGICVTIPPNHSQDAFGKAYNCGQTRDRCKRNNAIWAKALIDKYNGRESEGIYVVPLNVNLDTIYNMGLETMPVNARNTDVTYQSPIANGGVHPVTSGYWQIADVYTAFLQSHI